MSGELLWWLNLLVGVGIFTLLATSLNLINGHAGMFHLGHHGFWALGAYATAWWTIRLDGELSGPVLYGTSLLLSTGVAAVGGLAVGLPCLRLRGDYLAIATLAFGEVVRILIQNSDKGFLGGSQGVRLPRVFGEFEGEAAKLEFRALSLALVATLCVLAIWAISNFIRSGHGRRLLAVAQDETAAGLMGIDPTRPRVLAFVIGAAVAGLAGGVHAHFEGSLAPQEFEFMQTVKMFLIVVLGGMGSLSGCVVGAFLVVGTERLLARAGGAIADWWQVIFPMVLAIMIVVRPQGIFGRRELSDWFRALRRRRAAP